MAEDYGLEADACPHCGGKTRLEEHASMRWVCAACGGPRVPTPPPGAAKAVPRSGAEAQLLTRARTATLRAASARGIAGVLFAVASLFAVVGLFALSHAATMGIVVLACGVIALVSGTSQLSKRKAQTREAETLMNEAWNRVAEDVLRARGREITADELAASMRISNETAEAILSSLAVNDRARIDIGEDAELRYSSVRPGAPDEEFAAQAGDAPGASHRGAR